MFAFPIMTLMVWWWVRVRKTNICVGVQAVRVKRTISDYVRCAWWALLWLDVCERISKRIDRVKGYLFSRLHVHVHSTTFAYRICMSIRLAYDVVYLAPCKHFDCDVKLLSHDLRAERALFWLIHMGRHTLIAWIFPFSHIILTICKA